MAYESSSSGAAVVLGGRIDIFPAQPLPELDTANASAFAARQHGDAASDLYALVCLTGLPPRLDAVNAVRMLETAGIVRLIDHGVVSWTDQSQIYVFVYQKPTAPRMMASIDMTHEVPSDDVINHHFITPMIGSLLALANAGVTHNAIRPANIFWRMGNATPPQLGDCLSAPAGLGQPVFFEPVERALAIPLGRGTGHPADDCYAFGMVLALLVLGRNPLQGLDDRAIIDMKMQRGSFISMIGSQRMATTHIEILRGLLADDARQRWSASDLDQWLDGRRMTLKNSDAGQRASRHFDFAGKPYWQTTTLAVAFAENIAEAVKTIESESLVKWLRRAMNDNDRANQIEHMVRDLKQGGKTAHYEDQLVARVCIALDATGPIRYRGLSLLPQGLSALLAQAARDTTHVGVLSEIIASQLVSLWLTMQRDGRVEYGALLTQFDRMKGLIEKTGFGNGIERVTYELNPSLPCLSPLLRGQFVATPKALTAALERLAASGNRSREPLDRHIAAFLIARDKRGEGVFEALKAPEGSLKRGLAILTLLAELQYRHGPESLPHLAAWLAPFAEPALKRFFGKSMREHIHKQLQAGVSAGNLSALLRAIDDEKRLERDQQDFLAARLLYLNTQKEIAGLEVKLNNREAVVRGAGKPMAASISSFLAIILICAAIVRAVLEALAQDG